uniref:RNA-directed RNA polymerase n=1 Tax=Coleura bat reovirus TaxID=3141869 RepID=A0AAU7E2K3_9REOV
MNAQDLHKQIVRMQTVHWNMIKGIECNGFQHYKYQSCKIDFWKMNPKVRRIRSNYSREYVDIDKYDASKKFLPPVRVNEDHKFHKFLNTRANKECALYGYMRFSDWVWLLSNLCPESFGIRVLKGIIDEIGAPFSEISKRQYEFRDLKGSYIIPTQVEACLQMSLLEIDVLGSRKKGKISFTIEEKQIKITWKEKVRDKILFFGKSFLSKELYARIESLKQDENISFNEILKNYFKFLLPWPKEMNNVARHVIPWIVKYWAYFSDEFITLWYGDGLHPKKEDIPVLRPQIRKTANPNHLFLNNRGIYIEWSEMFEVVKEMPEFMRILTVSPFCEFDPDDVDTVRMLGLLLKLPVMGGFGRADKYASAPRSADENLIKDEEKTDIADTMFRNCLKLFDEANQERYMPLSPEDWTRTSFGYFKSTGASENVKMNLNTVREGDKGKISLHTKAGVGVVKGNDTFSKDMSRKFNVVGKQLSTGNRDVPVKATRTIFPIPLDVLVAQVCSCDHLLRYASTDIGTYEINSDRMAAQISSGSAESVGSRVLDDRDLIYASGTSRWLIITLDYGEYDSHCIWWNFREPIQRAFKDFFSHDEARFQGRTRVELFDCGYGDGRVHNTLWNIGRRVFRASSTKIKEYEVTKEWKKNKEKFHQLVFIPAGVMGIYVSSDKVEDNDGDILACSAIGEDFVTLTSHGSGELTTLLFNSIENLSLCDQFIQDSFLRKFLTFRLRRVVGDDLILICDLKTLSEPMPFRFDLIRDRMMDLVLRSGHVANPSKTFLGFGFVEYRQTHAYRGVLIPKDQVMLISSEKMKFVDKVQDFIGSIHAMFLTKISRGMNEELAEILFWYIIVTLTKMSTRRFVIDDHNFLNLYTGERMKVGNKSFMRSKDSKTIPNDCLPKIELCKCEKDQLRLGNESEVRRRFERFYHVKDVFFPSFYWYILPVSMNGGGIHPLSFYLVSNEGEFGTILMLYGKHVEFLWSMRYSDIFHWYSVESVEEYVKEIYDAIDHGFVSQLLPAKTRILRDALTTNHVKPWWRNEILEVVDRTVKMEKTILGRNFRGAESDIVKMIALLSYQYINVNLASDHNHIMNKLVNNAGFVYGYDIKIEFGDIIAEEVQRVMDPILPPIAALFRQFYFYADVDMKLLTRKARLDRILAKDAWMRNFVTSTNVLEGIFRDGIDVFNLTEVTVYLIGLGFLESVASDIANVLNGLEGDSGLLDIRDGGILADEFNISLGSRSRSRDRRIAFQCRMSNEEKTALRSAIFAREQICIQMMGKFFKEVVVTKKQYNCEEERLYAPLFISRRKNASGLQTARKKLCDIITLIPHG